MFQRLPTGSSQKVSLKDWRRVTRYSNMFILKNYNTALADTSIW